jgi:hypothetical protein
MNDEQKGEKSTPSCIVVKFQNCMDKSEETTRMLLERKRKGKCSL